MVAKARDTSSDASTEAEFVIRDEAGPFMILETLTEAVAIDETTDCERRRKKKREQGQFHQKGGYDNSHHF